MSQSPGPLLSLRSAFVLMLALVVAIIAGVLMLPFGPRPPRRGPGRRRR